RFIAKLEYLDIKGHHAALDYLLDIVRRQEPLTEAAVRELHKIILVEPYEMDALTQDGRFTKRRIIPGQYKSMPNHVRTSTGEVHYYAGPEETPAKMADLMAWYQRTLDKGDLHPLILAATFHYQFVMIHPFDDGNGRMARLLMNLLLMQAGFPPVIIPLDTKNEYLLALEQADADNDLEPFIAIIGHSLLNSLDLYLRGASGDELEEISDLDKKIAILETQIESMQAIEKKRLSVKQQRLDIYKSSLREFVKLILTQLGKFDKFFSSVVYSIQTEKSFAIMPLLNSEPGNIEQDLKNLDQKLELSDDIQFITISYNWGDFVHKKHENSSIFTLSPSSSTRLFIKITFTNEYYLIEFQLFENGYGIATYSEKLESLYESNDYTRKLSTTQIQQLTIPVTNAVLKYIERKISDGI
ncbi:MAG: Fic family protein, partial [Anaerolineales bacterium]|nr:Fic family protein [Anaerolineales bacterium]